MNGERETARCESSDVRDEGLDGEADRDETALGRLPRR